MQAFRSVRAARPGGRLCAVVWRRKLDNDWMHRGEEIRPKISADLRRALAEFDGPDGVVAPASTWIVSAAAP